MKVMMLGIATKQTEGGQPPTEEALLAMHKFNEELEKAGVLLDLGGLTPTSRGVRVRYSGSKRTVIDGPFPESKEFIAGYTLLEVKSLAEAVEWAKRAPFGVGCAMARSWRSRSGRCSTRRTSTCRARPTSAPGGSAKSWARASGPERSEGARLLRRGARR